MACSLVPSEGKLIVKKIDLDKKESLLILPSQKKGVYFAEIVATPKVGSAQGFSLKDVIIALDYIGNRIEYDDIEYFILKEDEVLCTINLTKKNKK